MKTYEQFIFEDHSLRPKNQGSLESRTTNRNEYGFNSIESRKKALRRKLEISSKSTYPVKSQDKYDKVSQKSKKRKDIQNRKNYLKVSTSLNAKDRKSDIKKIKEDTIKTYEQFITETNTTRAVSIAARLKGGINRLKAKMPGTQANKIQKISKRIDPKTYHESEINEIGDGPEDRTSGGRYRRKDLKNPEIRRNPYSDLAKREIKYTAPASSKGSEGHENRKIRRAHKTSLTHPQPKKGIQVAGKNHDARITYHTSNHNFRTFNRLNKMMEDELGPNAKKVQRVRKSLGISELDHEDDIEMDRRRGIEETIKPLDRGYIKNNGSKIVMKKEVDGKVSKKEKTMK